MYNKFELPTIEIYLSGELNNIYFKNIYTILNENYCKKAIISFSEEPENNCIIDNHIESLIKDFSNIEFYVPQNLSKRLNYFNYKSYKYINLQDIGMYVNMKILEETIIFLNINISNYFDNLIWELLEKFFENNKGLILIPNFDYSPQNISLKNYKNIFDNLLKINSGKISLTGLFKSVDMIIKHPCNAYLCSGEQCHSNKSNYPRYLYVTDMGIKPYKSKNTNIHFCKSIGNVEIQNFSNYLSTEYKNSRGHTNFLNLNKIIYDKYIMSRYFTIFSWNVFLDKEGMFNVRDN